MFRNKFIVIYTDVIINLHLNKLSLVILNINDSIIKTLTVYIIQPILDHITSLVHLNCVLKL